jgi:hypothetical protein
MATMVPITLTGTAQSVPIKVVDSTILRIFMPAAWTTADIGVLESETELGVYGPTYDDEGGIYTIAAAAGRRIRIDASVFQNARFVRFYSLNSQVAPRLLNVQVVLLREVIGMLNA